MMNGQKNKTAISDAVILDPAELASMSGSLNNQARYLFPVWRIEPFSFRPDRTHVNLPDRAFLPDVERTDPAGDIRAEGSGKRHI